MQTVSTVPRHGDLAGRKAWQRAVAGVYYGGLVVLLALIITKVVANQNPLTRHISQDSEGWVLALLLPLWIEYARPRLTGRRVEWVVTAAAGLVMFAVLLILYNSHTITGKVRTLNETFFALTFLILYVQAARRPSRQVAWGCALAVLILTVAVDHTSLMRFPTNLAEGVVMLILAPVAFDVTDRGILRPGEPSPLLLRQAWWVLLLVLPALFILVHHAHLGGPAGAADFYATRAQEAFVGMLLLELYFGLRRSRWLTGATGAPARPRRRHAR
ncbi:MAG TPA: hypothetical protein VH637_02525 [Streptosporangiaceae bacterium]|jgi:peptidoglycan/LPS O-acetylase OafA/YrhL